MIQIWLKHVKIPWNNNVKMGNPQLYPFKNTIKMKTESFVRQYDIFTSVIVSHNITGLH